MKLCFSTLGCCDRDMESIISLAKQYGMNAVELRGVGGMLNNKEILDFSSENIADTRNKFESCGVSPLVIGTSCRFHNPDKYEQALDEGKAGIDIARGLGARYVRVFGDKFNGNRSECTERIIAGLSYLCKCDTKIGVLLEVHGDFNTIEALSPIIEKMSAYQNFGILWDVVHSHRSYGEDWQKFYHFIRPYVRHVHIKDFSEEKNQLTLIGDGSVPIENIVSALMTDGYDGYFSLEWEKKWEPDLPDIEYALDGFVALMNRIG